MRRRKRVLDIFAADITVKRIVACGADRDLLRIALQSIAREFKVNEFCAFADILEGSGSMRALFPQLRSGYSIPLTESGRPADLADFLLRRSSSARYPERERSVVSGEQKGWQLSVACIRPNESDAVFLVALAEAAWC